MANAVAIDVGTTAARAVWLRGSPGNLEVVKALRVELEGDAPLGSLVRQLKVEKAPVQAFSLGVPGQAATLRYNLLPPVPDWRLELIMKYETEELAEKSGESLTNDFTRLEIPESESEDQILLMGLGKDAVIQPRIEEIEGSAGRVRLAIPSAFGLYHAYRQSHKGIPSETVLLADIGAEETQIVLVSEGRLLFARSVNFGGSQIDDAIANALGIKVDAARRLKEGIETGRIPDHLAESAQSSLRSGLGQLLSVLQSSVTFCRAQAKISSIEIDRVLVSGATTRLPMLRPFLEEGFQSPVEIFAPKVAGALPGAAQEWTIAVGLAAAQLDRSQFYLDLLPPDAKAKREFRERTVFSIGSAAVLLFALLIHFGSGYILNGRVAADSEAIEEEESRVARLEGEERTKRSENQKLGAKIERVSRETVATRFSAQVLDQLRSVVPDAIAVEKVELSRKEVDGQLGIDIWIEGRADNSDRKALDHMDQLESSLKSLSMVARTQLETEELDRGFRPFRLLVSPDREPPKGAKKSGRNSRRGGRSR